MNYEKFPPDKDDAKANIKALENKIRDYIKEREGVFALSRVTLENFVTGEKEVWHLNDGDEVIIKQKPLNLKVEVW